MEMALDDDTSKWVYLTSVRRRLIKLLQLILLN